MSTFTCNPCNPSCLTCDGLTSLNCLTCHAGKFLSSSQCLPCDSICKTCINSANNCTSCPTESVIYLISTQTPWTCSPTCPDGYYGETSTITCVACSNCKTCDLSIKNCTSCDSGKFLISSQTNWTCDTNCPFGYYGDTSLNTCKICDKNCETCNGSTSAHCITCKSGYYILSGICKVCDSKCATCMTLSTTCFSCPTVAVVTSLFKNECLLQCPKGYYTRTLDYTCQLCDTSCIACQDHGSFGCTECPGGYYLSPNSNSVVNITGTCLRCDVICNTCLTLATNAALAKQKIIYIIMSAKQLVQWDFGPEARIIYAQNVIRLVPNVYWERLLIALNVLMDFIFQKKVNAYLVQTAKLAKLYQLIVSLAIHQIIYHLINV